MTHKVIIIGAGFSGICCAVKLKNKGIDDFVVIEKSSGVGGTWYDNRYPGAECDVESHLYSFSFHPKHNWSKVYSDRDEIQEYLTDCCKAHNIDNKIMFDTKVESMVFVDNEWVLLTSRGVLKASFVVLSYSPLHYPNIPLIEGLDQFEGKVIHTSQWKDDITFEGKRVAVIGNGASGIQCIPYLASRASHLTVFQRTPQWVIPKMNRSYTLLEKTLFCLPLIQRIYRFLIYLWRECLFSIFIKNSWASTMTTWIAKLYLWWSIQDPVLRQNLTPSYPIGCKRILLSDEYYRCLNGSNTTVITTPIKSVQPTGVECVDGSVTPVDVLVFATGFDVMGTNKLLRITNQDQYLGMYCADRRNLFTVLGRNSGSSYTSMILYIETQSEHITNTIMYLILKGYTSIEVKKELIEKHSKIVQGNNKKFVWNSCNNWYLNEKGENYTLYPGTISEFNQKILDIRKDDFEIN